MYKLQEVGVFLLSYKHIKITIGNLQYSADQTMNSTSMKSVLVKHCPGIYYLSANVASCFKQRPHHVVR